MARRRRDPTSAAAHGYGPNQGGHMIRNQPRGPGARWVRAPGLNAEVCQNVEGDCRALLLPRPPWEGGGYPDVCHRCGTLQVWETCTHGRCEGIPDPAVMRSGGYPECGARAVAVENGRPRCAEHLDPTPSRRLEDALRALPEGVRVRFFNGEPRPVPEALAELSENDRGFYVYEYRTERRWTLSLGTGEVIFTVVEGRR
jgi:hypothetical protein